MIETYPNLRRVAEKAKYAYIKVSHAEMWCMGAALLAALTRLDYEELESQTPDDIYHEAVETLNTLEKEAGK